MKYTCLNFYPRPPRGGRPRWNVSDRLFFNFYPRPPRGGRLDRIHRGLNNMAFLSTPSARRATKACAEVSKYAAISIHALREEGDQHVRDAQTGAHTFLSTPSARRATDRIHRGLNNIAFLSTPSARRATDDYYRVCNQGGISIHALREEGD